MGRECALTLPSIRSAGNSYLPTVHIMNTTTTRIAILLATLVLAPFSSADARDVLALQVSPRTAMGPTSIRVRAVVEHDSTNRMLEVSADSGGVYQSSAIELDGDEAARINEVVFRDMPQGEYEIVVRLLDSSGRVRAMARSTVTIAGQLAINSSILD